MRFTAVVPEYTERQSDRQFDSETFSGFLDPKTTNRHVTVLQSCYNIIWIRFE